MGMAQFIRQSRKRCPQRINVPKITTFKPVLIANVRQHLCAGLCVHIDEPNLCALIREGRNNIGTNPRCAPRHENGFSL
jgi:hypothetical protein